MPIVSCASLCIFTLLSPVPVAFTMYTASTLLPVCPTPQHHRSASQPCNAPPPINERLVLPSPLCFSAERSLLFIKTAPISCCFHSCFLDWFAERPHATVGGLPACRRPPTKHFNAPPNCRAQVFMLPPAGQFSLQLLNSIYEACHIHTSPLLATPRILATSPTLKPSTHCKAKAGAHAQCGSCEHVVHVNMLSSHARHAGAKGRFALGQAVAVQHTSDRCSDPSAGAIQ